MIDVALLRSRPELTGLLRQKDPQFDVDRLLALDERRRELTVEVEQLRARKNELAKQGQKGITEHLRQESVAVGKQLKDQEQQLERAQGEFRDLSLQCPNIPDVLLPVGGKEANKVVRTVGEQPRFDFAPLNHVDLGKKNGWLNFEAAAMMAGSQFAFYQSDAVKLIYALARMMLKNNVAHGFTPFIPPYLVNEQSLTIASNFPKFKDNVYEVVGENLYLTPTAEVNLTNLYRDSIIAFERLPIRMTAWTSCFRREAGGYGAHERGLIRIHQFEKVELYSIVAPEESSKELERMVACAETILKELGLHYRVSLLAMQDCSFPSAKTYDIEVWMPGQQAYMEVSSCSNCTDFQARRGAMRFKRTPDAKNELVHTLNASSLALPRLMVALMETYQQADGSIKLPTALQLYMDW